MKTIVENIKESREILDDFYSDLDDYEKLFESVSSSVVEIEEEIDDSNVIKDIKNLIDKYNSYMSNSKDPLVAELEEKIYLNVANQLENIIKRRKDNV